MIVQNEQVYIIGDISSSIFSNRTNYLYIFTDKETCSNFIICVKLTIFIYEKKKNKNWKQFLKTFCCIKKIVLKSM